MMPTIKICKRCALALATLSYATFGQAADCSKIPYAGPPEDQSRVASGRVGEWNQTFTQSLITIKDEAGKDWQYFALEKKPQQPKSLIVFLHGFLEFSWAWEQQLDHFGDSYHAVALDLKGHHYSSKPDDVSEYDFHKLSGEIREVIQCLGYSKATIVGHDFGGAIAWSMGMLQPDVVEGLVVASVPHPYTLGRAWLDPNSDQTHRSRYMGYAQGDSLFDKLRFAGFVFSDTSIFDSGFYSGKRIFRLIDEVWLPASDWKAMKNYYRAMPFPAREEDFPAPLSEDQHRFYTVKRPTLLLWGMKDPYFAFDSLNGIEALVPDLELVTYDEATHWLHHEAEDLNMRIETFVEQNQSAGR